MTIAYHSSVFPMARTGAIRWDFLTIARKRIYFACDTALFEDMKLIGLDPIDLAVLPIGDLFTMGPEHSLRAIELLAPRMVAPAHYNTWPPIEQDVQEWATERPARHHGSAARGRTGRQDLRLGRGPRNRRVPRVEFQLEAPFQPAGDQPKAIRPWSTAFVRGGSIRC
jgi:hypothetical protein